MKALISTLEPRESGLRVADIHPTGFETTTDFYWVNCPDDMERDSKWFDPQTQAFMDFPVQELVVPSAATTVTPLQYVERFTDAEQLAIVTATMNNPVIKLWYDKLMAASEVVFSDPRLSAGMDAMVAAGLITQARSEEILPLDLRSTGMTTA